MDTELLENTYKLKLLLKVMKHKNLKSVLVTRYLNSCCACFHNSIHLR